MHNVDYYFWKPVLGYRSLVDRPVVWFVGNCCQSIILTLIRRYFHPLSLIPLFPGSGTCNSRRSRGLYASPSPLNVVAAFNDTQLPGERHPVAPTPHHYQAGVFSMTLQLPYSAPNDTGVISRLSHPMAACLEWNPIDSLILTIWQHALGYLCQEVREFRSLYTLY